MLCQRKLTVKKQSINCSFFEIEKERQEPQAQFIHLYTRKISA